MKAMRLSGKEIGRYVTETGQQEAKARKHYTISRRVAVRTWDGKHVAALYIDGHATTLTPQARKALASVLRIG